MWVHEYLSILSTYPIYLSIYLSIYIVAGHSVQQQRLHDFKCSQRVVNFGQLRADLTLMQGGASCNETVAACDYLEQQHED